MKHLTITIEARDVHSLLVAGCNIQQEVVNKMEFNRTRTHRHGGRIL